MTGQDRDSGKNRDAPLRLDRLLVMRSLFDSREKAVRAIESGAVRVNGAIVTDRAARVSALDKLDVLFSTDRYVGRGGLKLAAALAAFRLSVAGRVVLDVGASTGGFTDCLLQEGASFVHAVDVGRGQLHPSLRQDSRVACLEGLDIRHLPPGSLSPSPDFFTVDVSFISLHKVLPALLSQLPAACRTGIALVKPQFEAGPGVVDRHGVVRDSAVHRRVLLDLAAFLETAGLRYDGLVPSPIRGGEGNIEYLAWIGPIHPEEGQGASERPQATDSVEEWVVRTVAAAFANPGD